MKDIFTNEKWNQQILKSEMEKKGMACDFIIQLGKLRKQSAESVENTNDFGEFKEYLHVERQVEVELRKLLREINLKQKKCLVLLCGSAGDGKSHLISYLKNSDQENLLVNFEPYNDASESNEPTRTSIDTLADKLSPFSDSNYENQDETKMIIAINLGTLNNFIDSQQGKSFLRLGEYVKNNNIFSSYTQASIYHEDSVFQHVSFSDYQVFSLGKDGIKTDFLKQLLQKIFRNSENNPFYNLFIKCKNCPRKKRCPVNHNYLFLCDDAHQMALINRVVEAVLVDKSIVSTRDILNLLYDLIVHPEFESETDKIDIGVPDAQLIQNYIMWTTPMLLNEFEDVSPLLDAIRKHDTLKERTAIIDENATYFHSLEDIRDEFLKISEGTPYRILDELTSLSVCGKNQELKKIIYKFTARLEDLNGVSKPRGKVERLDEFIRYLYSQNTNNERDLEDLYDATKNAVLCWNGQFGEDYICIDDTNDNFWVLERLQIEPSIDQNTHQIKEDIRRFSPTLKLKFKKHGDNSVKPVEIRIDFSLFDLIADMRDGYRPTIQDKNTHADFTSFVQRLIEFGDKSTSVRLIPKNSNAGYEAIVGHNVFGYTFEVKQK